MFFHIFSLGQLPVVVQTAQARHCPQPREVPVTGWMVSLELARVAERAERDWPWGWCWIYGYIMLYCTYNIYIYMYMYMYMYMDMYMHIIIYIYVI